MSEIFETNSSMYGLTNHLYGDDLGRSNISRMISPGGFGMSPMLGGSVTMHNTLNSDKVQISTRKEQDSKNWKTALSGLAVLGAGLFTYKFGKAGIIKAWNGLKNLGTKISSKFKKTP